MDATQILKTRVTPETKARVVKIAQGELLTEAVWLRRLVAKALHERPALSFSRRHLGAVPVRRGANAPKTVGGPLASTCGCVGKTGCCSTNGLRPAVWRPRRICPCCSGRTCGRSPRYRRTSSPPSSAPSASSVPSAVI